jgi:hypothetical protein
MRFDFRDSFSYRDAVSAVGHLSYECCQAAFQAFIGLVLSLRCEGAAFLWVALRAVFVPDPPPPGGETREEMSAKEVGVALRLPQALTNGRITMPIGNVFPAWACCLCRQSRTDSYPLPQADSGLTRCLDP